MIHRKTGKWNQPSPARGIPELLYAAAKPGCRCTWMQVFTRVETLTLTSATEE
jgi:hypothetical protein